MEPSVSVVVPTFDRMDVLPEVLAALEAQQGAPPFEVVVVDDGSGPETGRFLASWNPDRPFRAVRQENRGPAAARNRGVDLARGRLVAFLGDDTVPREGWLRSHLAAHEGRGPGPLAVVGYTSWHPRIRRTPFLEYVNEHGLQFGYALIDDPDDVPFNFFYTSNVSLPRELLVAEPMNLDFPYAAWEDIELSYRLTRRRGLRIVYEPRAVVDHDHPTDFDRFARRQEKAGYSAVVFARLHPELSGFLGVGPEGPPPLPPRGRQRFREMLVRTLQKLPVRLPAVWDEALRFHYIEGLRRGWEELGGGGRRKGEEP